MTDLVNFLKQKLVSEVVSPQKEVIQAKRTDSALEGFHKLVNHQILSLPLFDDEEGNYNGLLDILDVMFFICKDSTTDDQEAKLRSVTCGEIANFSGLDSFFPLSEDLNLLSAIQTFFLKYNCLHRLPVVNSQGNLVGILSQATLVKYLEPYTNQFDFGHLDIAHLGIGLDKTVVSVSAEETVSYAMQTLKEKKISGVAITKDGKFFGVFSADDIKRFGIGKETLAIGNYKLGEFLKKKKILRTGNCYKIIYCLSNYCKIL